MKNGFFRKVVFFVLLAATSLTFCGCDVLFGSLPGGDTAESYERLSFYAVNDLHGKFMDTDEQPGVDELSTYIKQLYADPAREEILLSSGDMWQGTVESSANRGALMTEWMNEMDFVGMTLGNHEYDWGATALSTNSENAEFPFLAINVTYNGRAVDYCSPSVVVERGELKIGIIGAIGDCLSSISGEHKNGLRFATGSALTALVKAESTRLRQEEGCDFIVYSLHDGYESSSSSILNFSKQDLSYYDEELSNGYVDLVFEGHTHRSYIGKDAYGVYHLQGGGENKYISCADVDYDTANGSYVVTPRLIARAKYADEWLDDDPVVEELFNKYFPTDNPYETVIGYNYAKRTSSDICRLVANLYLQTGENTWGDEYDVVLGGGFLNARSPYELTRGDVTYAQLYSLLPFDNTIVLGKIKGSDLKLRFFQNDRYYTSLKTDFSYYDIESSQYYYIVVDTYTSTYTWNNITEIARFTDGVYARDLVADYIGQGGWAQS